MLQALEIVSIGSNLLATGIDGGHRLVPLGQASAGGLPDLVVWGLLGVLLIIIILVATRTLRPKRPPISEEPKGALPKEKDQSATVAEEAGHAPSLREVKASRAAKVTDEIKSREALLQARQARKGATRKAIEQVESQLTLLPQERETPPAEEPTPPEPFEPTPPTEPPGPVALPLHREPAASKPEPVADKVRPSGPPRPLPSPPLDIAQPPSSLAVAPADAGPPPPAAGIGAPRSLEEGLEKTRKGFVQRLKGLFSKRTRIDDGLMGELEEVLFTADIGVKTSQILLEKVQEKIAEQKEPDPQRVWALLRTETQRILETSQKPFGIGAQRPAVILVIGVNGVGKTTTIGKLASKFKTEGLKVLLVAADTFRAAATDQLSIWAERVGCQVFTAPEGRDPPSVVFDAVKLAIEEHYDVVVADTAGRLHTKVNLVEELKKVHRVTAKALPGAPHHVMLVLDANTGQNAIAQAQMFNKEVGITGIILTKLDGTAKGGVVIGISDELAVPVQFIGIGEQVEDLREFDAHEFAEAIFS
ncbi:MAG: signal recognition particle-docking protein FtsY [Bradymonadales bacterium]|nr:signal recognition particle-docking protein FtsY [Bradymonadales bacterium]